MPVVNQASNPARTGSTEIAYPTRGAFTQGTIFTGGMAENYAGCEVCGIVITARCDAANDKVDVYNYVPIVRFDDWIHRDGRLFLGERFRNESYNSMRSVLQEGGFSASVLETQSIQSIAEALFPAGGSKKSETNRKRFEEAASKYEFSLRVIHSHPSEHLCNLLVNEAPRLRDNLLKELFGYRLGGHYFIRRNEPQGVDLGFVALLREIQAIPRDVALRISEGIDSESFTLLCAKDASLSSRMAVPHDSYAMPVGVLRSPNLEHFMQAFSMLFGRIGIADHDNSYMNSIWYRQPSFSEVQ